MKKFDDLNKIKDTMNKAFKQQAQEVLNIALGDIYTEVFLNEFIDTLNINHPDFRNFTPYLYLEQFNKFLEGKMIYKFNKNTKYQAGDIVYVELDGNIIELVVKKVTELTGGNVDYLLSDGLIYKSYYLEQVLEVMGLRKPNKIGSIVAKLDID